MSEEDHGKKLHLSSFRNSNFSSTILVSDFLGDSEHSAAISYDTLNDMFDAFRMIQKTHHADGDMISADALRRLLSTEAERMSEQELDKVRRSEERGMRIEATCRVQHLLC